MADRWRGWSWLFSRTSAASANRHRRSGHATVLWVDVVRLREALFDSSLDNPPDVPVRPLAALAELWADEAIREKRRAADDAHLSTVLPGILTELHVHAVAGDEGDRGTALRLLVDLCTSPVNVLRHLGQIDLAWISADRAEKAARLLDDPVMIGAAAVAQASSRPSAAMARPLRDADRIAEAGRIAGRLGEQPTESPGEGWRSLSYRRQGPPTWWRAALRGRRVFGCVVERGLCG